MKTEHTVEDFISNVEPTLRHRPMSRLDYLRNAHLSDGERIALLQAEALIRVADALERLAENTKPVHINVRP